MISCRLLCCFLVAKESKAPRCGYYPCSASSEQSRRWRVAVRCSLSVQLGRRGNNVLGVRAITCISGGHLRITGTNQDHLRSGQSNDTLDCSTRQQHPRTAGACGRRAALHKTAGGSRRAGSPTLLASPLPATLFFQLFPPKQSRRRWPSTYPCRCARALADFEPQARRDGGLPPHIVAIASPRLARLLMALTTSRACSTWAQMDLMNFHLGPTNNRVFSSARFQSVF